jgi:hypothetical protein
MVQDKIANYRLTRRIIQEELLQMFPATSSTTLDIRVCSNADCGGRKHGRDANSA